MSRFLNQSLDKAAIDGSKTLIQRLVVAALASLVLQASLGVRVMLLWLLALVVSEVMTWIATRRISVARPGTTGERLLFVLHIALSTSLWSLICVWMWFSTHFGLRAVGAIVICAQLIHAQAYTYRSRIIWTLSAGIPAGVISVLTLGYADLAGRDLMTAIAGLGLAFAYVEAGTRANIANARRMAAAQLELERLAYTDSLTALANRRRFSERLKELIDHSREHHAPFALVLVDLDGFKAVNDAFGHDIGDDVLIAVAKSLCDVAHETDHLARLGGDEFALLVRDIGSSSYAATIFRNIAEAISANETLAGYSLQTTLSIGTALYPDDARASDDLFKAADIALYEAKSAGRNTWRAYQQGGQAVPVSP